MCIYSDIDFNLPEYMFIAIKENLRFGPFLFSVFESALFRHEPCLQCVFKESKMHIFNRYEYSIQHLAV